jgi:hypothetical protein
MAPKGSYKEHHKTSICNYKFIEKSKLVVVFFFCLFSKLTLVASMEYPVPRYYCLLFLRFLTFVYSYTRIKCQREVFSFSRSVLEWYCYLWFLFSNWYFLNTIQFRFRFFAENLECSLIHLSSTSCWYWQCFRHRHLLYSIATNRYLDIFVVTFNERHLNPVFVFVRTKSS